MADFSSTEIEAAVSQFVKSNISVQRDALGPIDLQSKFSEVLQLVSSTLIFDPNSIFYLIFLVSNKLNSLVETTLADVDDLTQAVKEMGHKTTKVTKTSLLGDAAAALFSVDQILNEQNVISQTPFTRYQRAVDAFTAASLAPNIRQVIDLQVQVARPPQEARADSLTLLTSLSTNYATILSSLEQLEAMLDEFRSLDLSVLTIQDSVRKVRTDLRALQDAFEDPSASDDDKISYTRDAYLRLTAGKAVLTNLSTIRDPEEPRLRSSDSVSGKASVPLSGGRLTPATIRMSKSAPWIIKTGVNDQFSIREDSAVAPTTYTITPSPYPVVQNYRSGPFALRAASYASLISANAQNYVIPAAPDNEFSVTVDGAIFVGPVTSGSRTGAQVVADILAMVDADTGLISLSTVINATYSLGVVLTHLLPGDHTIIINNPPGTTLPAVTVNSVLGFTAGTIGRGNEANNVVEIDGHSPVITLTTGASVSRAQVVSDILTWVAANVPGQYTATDTGSAIEIRKTIPGSQTVTMTADYAPEHANVVRAYQELGFYVGQSDSSEAVSAVEIASMVNGVGLINAAAKSETFESGTDGTTTGPTTIEFPAGSIPASRVGMQLYIQSGINAGPHRITSIVIGFTDVIVVSTDTPFIYTGIDQHWVIVDEYVQLTSKASDLSTKLLVSAGTADTELGLATGAVYGTTTGFTTNTLSSFTRADVVVGDVLRIPSEPDREISLVTSDTQVEVTPPLPTNATGLSFQVLSTAALAYEQLIVDLAAWDSLIRSSAFATDLRELQRVMNPLLNNTRPTDGQINKAVDLLTFENLISPEESGLKPLLEQLRDALVAFEVNRVSRIDAALNMLQERGMDRAYDHLMDGKLAAVFSFDKDDAASSAYMLKTSRAVAQEDVPVSKSDEAVGDTVAGNEIVGTDADFDVSDMDPDENLSLLGEIADYSDEDASEATKRY